MKNTATIVLPHFLAQTATALLASGGAVLYTLTELPGMVLLVLFLLFQVATYIVIKGVGSIVQPVKAVWLHVLQQVVLSGFVVMLLSILAVVFWIVFEYSIWHVSGNGDTGYAFYLEHVVVSVVPQMVEMLVLGEILRQTWVWLLGRQWASQNLTTSD